MLSVTLNLRLFPFLVGSKMFNFKLLFLINLRQLGIEGISCDHCDRVLIYILDWRESVFYRGKELEESLPPLIFIPKYFLYRTQCPVQAL